MISKVKHTIYSLLLLSLVGMPMLAVAQSQRPSVTARITPDSIMIGDRFTLTIEVEKDLVQSLAFPHFEKPEGDKAGSLECIEDAVVDTVEVVGRKVRLRKRYVMTIFDEGIYSLGRPQVLYADKNIVDTLYAQDSLRIVVNTFRIDSLSGDIKEIRDLKPQKTLPFRFGEIAGYLGYAFLAAVIVALALFGVIYYLGKRGKKISDLFRPTPPPPPHIVAISALEALHNQKLWQNNKHKQYYSALSDILRTYIDGRFDIGAMEMTTDEIIEAVRGVEIPQKSAMDLVSILRDADLVKFAKAMPEADENEGAYNKAYYFVEETKPVEESDEEEINKEAE